MRAWIGLGFQRGSPKDSSVNDFATSNPTSIPTRSISSKGPMRNPPPTRQMRSISSWPAIPSPSSRRASAKKGRPQRLTRKPGPSAARITRLPIARPVSQASARAGSPVCSALITSSSFISGGGLKKCMPTTFSGRRAAPASDVTGIDEVFVASTVSAPQSSDSWANRSRLRSARSGAASITRSHPASPSSAEADSRRPSAEGSTRPFSTHLERPDSTASAPWASAWSSGSWSRVRMPAAQPSWAIPEPIVPAPTTPRTT